MDAPMPNVVPLPGLVLTPARTLMFSVTRADRKSDVCSSDLY